MRRTLAIFAALMIFSAIPSAVQAQNWPDTLFSERSHDFGPVPRGGIVRHPFVLTNQLNVPITILNLRVSCGCTSGTASASVVPPGKTAVVEAQMDTRNFVGRKSTTLFVSVMAGNAQTEIGLGVSSMILSDVVLNPGAVDFGAISKGQTAEQVLTIDRVGKPDWRVTRMVSASKALTASLHETQRVGENVSYRLSVALRPDAPAGTLRDEIRLLTNDPETPGIPVLVNAQIKGELTATPSLLSLGQVPSTGTQGRYIVRATKPFSITRIDGTGDGFKLGVDDATKKPMHLVTLLYNPAEGTTRGDLTRRFRIATDLPGEPPLDVTATLRVDP